MRQKMEGKRESEGGKGKKGMKWKEGKAPSEQKSWVRPWFILRIVM